MSIPNFITLCRLILTPVIIWLVLERQVGWAFWLFVVAGVSDALDGLIAKQFDRATRLGAYLDPIADKALLVSIYVTLGMTGGLPGWLVMLVVSRDLLIVGGVLLSFTLGYRLAMQPLMISKANTVAQITLAGLVLAQLGLSLAFLEPIVFYLLYLTAVTTAISGCAYIVDWVGAMSAAESDLDRQDDNGE